MFQIERDANVIARQTRRGKGNIIMCSADVASALAAAGQLDYAPALEGNNRLQVDDTGNTFAGVLNGRYRVYIDPYATITRGGTNTASGNNYYVVGYKGTSAYDAGMFYCPYVPLQMVRSVGAEDFHVSGLRLVMAWYSTHSLRVQLMLLLTQILWQQVTSVLTYTTEEFLLQTSCDPLASHYIKDPSGSFLCL